MTRHVCVRINIFTAIFYTKQSLQKSQIDLFWWKFDCFYEVHVKKPEALVCLDSLGRKIQYGGFFSAKMNSFFAHISKISQETCNSLYIFGFPVSLT